MNGKLVLSDGTEFEGKSFGSLRAVAGEVVFSTGMVGYPEGLTDPSYESQILILTYPLVGNYGVPEKDLWESEKIHVAGLIVSNYIDTPSHFQSKLSLGDWFKQEKVPLLQIKDTRLLAQMIRDKGVILGKIIFDKDIPLYDPNKDNLVSKVSTGDITFLKSSKNIKKKTILLIDCGAKRNIQRALLDRGVDVVTVPWDYDPFAEKDILEFDAVVLSNGPGNPKFIKKTINTVKKFLSKKIPLLGICLGHQILALAAGGDTKKLKFGHRSQNQPCKMENSTRCFITTQNHGFAVSKVPNGFKSWFINANDFTNEGIIHENLPIMSVQFHPEAIPGPEDTEWIFDYFLEKI